jgi:hypothetical protein
MGKSHLKNEGEGHGWEKGRSTGLYSSDLFAGDIGILLVQ